MKEVRIELDNGKIIRQFIVGLAISALLLLGAYYMVFYARTIYVYFLIFVVVGSVAGVFFSIKQLLRIFDKNRVGLLLNSRGIEFRGTELGRKVGFVEWADVDSISVDETVASKAIYLRISNAKYYERMTNKMHINALSEKGLVVNGGELKVPGFKALRELVKDYYVDYRNRAAEQVSE